MKNGYYINNKYYFDTNITHGTIFQKCSNIGIDIPCFCYHESLNIAGNCRMCLVEASNSLKLVVSCAMPITNDVKIFTSNKRVKKARESVLEFLLINHPLDCPICDQGGECDLQDITLMFGSDKGRFYEYTKRAIFNRDCGPLIKMLMTRCIHCTRCVRFLNEIAVTNDLGMFGRGEDSEIGTYINNSLVDELSGNIIDLCPVGALTSKPYSFTARPWELNNMESVDILDSLASNIRIDYLNNKVYRILPIYNKYLNEDWISNKARFFYDSNDSQRILYPMFKVDNKFVSLNWNKSFYIFFLHFFNKLYNNVIAFFGMFNDFDLVNSITKFFNKLGTEVYINNNFFTKFDFRNQFLIEKIFTIFENIINILFININLRIEFPILNFKLRKMITNNDKINVYSIGLSGSYYNIPIKFFGNSLNDFFLFFKGKNKLNLDLFYNKIINSLFFINDKFINLKVFISIFNIVIFNSMNFLQNWLNKYFVYNINFFYDNISYVNIFELNNFKNINSNIELQNSFIFLENLDDYYFLSLLKSNNFIVYHGFFFDYGAKISNLLIPSFSNFEFDSIFFNIEGKLKKSKKVISKNSIINNSDFFIILKVFSSYFFKFNFSILKNFNKILGYFNIVKIDFNININYKKNLIKNNVEYFVYNINFFYDKTILFNSNIFNYYKHDIYSLNSKTMHLASLDYLVKLKTFL